jgi:hypothetical protein
VKYRIRFNPYHDSDGKFTTADHSVDSPDQLLSYMRTLYENGPGYHPNIANLKVAGKAILNPEKSLGLKRDQMPQIPTANRDNFLSTVPNHDAELDPRSLNPTQAQIDGYKTAKFMIQSMENTDRFRPPIVSRDKFVIDGHHNWASRVVQAVANPSANVMIPVRLVDMSRDDLLAHAHSYAAERGFEAKPIHKFNPNHRPAGSPDGGQFAPTGDTDNEQALREFDSHFGPYQDTPYVDYSGNEHHSMETQAAHDLHKELDQEAIDWVNKQPALVKEDFRRYIGTDYAPLNNYLRTGDSHSKYGLTMSDTQAQSMAARMQRALSEAPVMPDGTVLYRAFRSDAVIARAERGELVDSVFQDKAFLSTTTNPSTLREFYEDKDNKSNAVLLRMTTRDGTRGFYTAATYMEPKLPHEYEVVLNKSMPVYVSRVTKLSTGALIVDADVYGDHSKTIRFNPNHVPAGSTEGGQFAPNEYDIQELGSENNEAKANDIHALLVNEGVKYRSNLALNERLALDAYQNHEYAHMNAIAAAFGKDRIPDTITDENREKVLQAVETVNARLDGKYGYASPVAPFLHSADLERALDGAPNLPDNLKLYRVFRSADLTAVAPHMIGKEITESRFLSTTAYAKVAENWSKDKQGFSDLVALRLTTQNAHGLYLTGSRASFDPWEHEVLFNRNTSMTITKVTPIRQGGVLIDATIGKAK